MIAFVRLLLVLVATAMVACPVMASDLHAHDESVAAVSNGTSVQVATCHDELRPDGAEPGNLDGPCPDRSDCSIASIIQAAPAPYVSPPVETNIFVAIPAGDFASDLFFIKGFATGPPVRRRGQRAFTPLVLKQRLLI